MYQKLRHKGIKLKWKAIGTIGERKKVCLVDRRFPYTACTQNIFPVSIPCTHIFGTTTHN